MNEYMTATSCKKCNALIFYDKEAPKPELCPICEHGEEKADGEKA